MVSEAGSGNFDISNMWLYYTQWNAGLEEVLGDVVPSWKLVIQMLNKRTYCIW